MNEAREDRLEQLFEEASALRPEQRAAFFEEVGKTDEDILTTLQALVSDAEKARDFGDRVLGPAVASVAGNVLGDSQPGADNIDSLVGQQVAHFQIIEMLGGGGMGRVYKAVDLKLDRVVALKFLPSHLSTDDDAKRRFAHEAKSASALEHPNICVIHDIGETDVGQLFIAMAYCEGETLKKKIARGPVPVSEALEYVAQVAEGLRRAHEAGIVHRDVKPANVMVTGAGVVKIVDFGLAKMAGTDVTREGAAIGTVAYMSPEQTRGEAVDSRSDLWSLGAVLFELLTGQRPFRAESDEALIYSIRHDTPKSVREVRAEVPPALAAVVSRCLAKEPAERYQRAGELLAELRTIQRDGSTRRRVLFGGPGPTAGRMPAAVKPHRRTAFIAGGVLVAALVAAGAYALSRSSPPSIALGHSRQITSAPGLEIHPVISPDGKLIAYAAGNARRMRVFIRPVAGGRTIPLSDDSSAVESQPRWSPDGNQLLFLSRGGVSIAPALGGSARAVINPGQSGVISADWSPDGSSIAFVRGDSVFTVGLKGDAPRLIAVDDGINSCAWSNSNRWLACVRGNYSYAEVGEFFGNHAQCAIVLVSLTDGALSEITTSGSLNAAPLWAPGGSLLYFVSDRDGPRDIYAVEIGSGGRPRTKPSRVSAGLGVQTLSLAASGRELAYSVYSSRANIWSIPIPAAGAVNSGAATPVTTGNQEIEGVRTSRDGRWLLYDSNVHGRANIYRMPIGGGEPEQLTNEPFDVFAADLSPDGSAIVYHSFRTGKRQIEVKPLNGGPIEHVTAWPADLCCAVWSPDGRFLAFREWSPRSRYYVSHRIAPGRWAEPVYVGVAHAFPRWFADQRFIFSTNVGVDPADSSSQGIALVPADPRGSSARRVLYRAGPNDPGPESPESTPDGKSIIFKTHDAAGQAALWSLARSGGAPRLLVRFTDPDRQSNRIEFATDGKRVFFTIDEKQSDVYVADLVKR